MRKALEIFLDCMFHVPAHPRRRQAGFAAWVPAIIAGVQAISSNVQSNRASGDARHAQEQAEGIQGGLLSIAQNQDARANSLYERYTNTFIPAENRYINAAETPLNANVEAGKAVADVDQAQAGERAALQRNEARYGINPYSGMAIAANKDMAVSDAAVKAGAATNARRYASAETLRRLGTVVNMGQPDLSAAMGLEGSSAGIQGGVAGYYNGVAGRASDLAGSYGQQAGYGLAQFMNTAPMYSGPGGVNDLAPPLQMKTTPIYQPPGG